MAVNFEDRLPKDEALTNLRNQFVDTTLMHTSTQLHRYITNLIGLLADNMPDLEKLVTAFGLDASRLPAEFKDKEFIAQIVDEADVIEDLHALMLEFVVDRIGMVFDYEDWSHAPEGYKWTKGPLPKAMLKMNEKVSEVNDRNKTLDV